VSTIDLNGKTYFKLSDLEQVTLNGEVYVSPTPNPGSSREPYIIDSDGDRWEPSSLEPGKWTCDTFQHITPRSYDEIDGAWGIREQRL
jgi:hypothetical protein